MTTFNITEANALMNRLGMLSLQHFEKRLMSGDITAGELAVLAGILHRQGWDVSENRLPRSLAAVLAATSSVSEPKALPSPALTFPSLRDSALADDLPPRVE